MGVMPSSGIRLLFGLYPVFISSTINSHRSRIFALTAESRSQLFRTPTQSHWWTRLYSSMEQKNCPALMPEDILKRIQSFIPPLTFEQHKGQSGRIGVIGGCEEYTGAPYFAAISALKLGADLAHVFCTRSAASVIKSYSPELIVHPLLDDKDGRLKMMEWIPRLHVVVIGPGLGRDPNILNMVLGIVEDLKKQRKPLVIDADGLFMVTNNLNIIRGYKNAILTPNSVEFKRLADAIGNISETNLDDRELTASASKAFGGLVIARKLRHDLISDGESVIEVVASGSPRRCGGQGDLLSGAAAVFFHWALLHESTNPKAAEFAEYKPGVLSAYAACLLSKLCAETAYQKNGRSTTTSDLINEIHFNFDKHFEVRHHKL